ncbi:MAG: cobalamin-dependent protein [Anaerolineales bacterium]|nr:cobalamin-dependent protein [Anaerolineales bacterium]MDW8162954.1 cobalamin-dependent protein [Anaerolineales bacterium]
MITPLIKERFRGNESGVILLGTVEADIHDIGKNNLSLLLTSYGFTVHDLGVDVPPSEFLRQALARHPDIIGLSGLLTSSYDSMRRTVQLCAVQEILKWLARRSSSAAINSTSRFANMLARMRGSTML